MVEALRANIEYEQSHGLATAKRLTLVSECPTTLSMTVFTQRNSVADFLQANGKCDFTRKTVVLRFEPPPPRGLRDNVRCSC